MTNLISLHSHRGIFSGSQSPCGLYARQKWLGEERNPGWCEDYDTTVDDLRHGQGTNGLWHNSPLVTIHRLFGLHLTVRQADRQINTALDALLASVAPLLAPADNLHVSRQELTSLPFASGRWEDIAIPATLFLCTIFDRPFDLEVLALYDRIVSELSGRQLDTTPPARVHNIFRALVVHPEYATHQTTMKVVDWYARRQAADGHWGAEIPFYQALNALAHLSSTAAEKQCHAAFTNLPSRQNVDGSWGREEQQWHTFLTLHALRNKGRLRLRSP